MMVKLTMKKIPCHWTLLIIFLVNKFKCGQTSNSDCSSQSPLCVCSYQFLIMDLKALIQNSYPSDLIGRITSYQCQQYRRLPSELFMSIQQSPQHNNNNEPFMTNQDQSSSGHHGSWNQWTGHQNPVVVNPQNPHEHFVKTPHFGVNQHSINPHHDHRGGSGRKKRQLSEPTHNYYDDGQDSLTRLKDAVPKIPKDSSHHIYAILGHRVQLHCHTATTPVTYVDYPRFEWVHSNGNPISAPGVTINQISGELDIYSAQLSDIDVYNCSCIADGEFENGHPKKVFSNTFQLSVVTDSIHWLSVTVYYQTNECSILEMNTIQLNLNEWISANVCPTCVVHDSSIICDPAADTNFNEYELKFALTTFNMESEIDGKVNPVICTPVCVQAVHLLLLQIVQQSVKKLFALPIRLTDGTIIYAKQDSAQFEFMTGCLAGFEFMYKLCFPCQPGHFSTRGYSDCVQCQNGSYQNSLGASRCNPCDEGYDTVGQGAVASWQCLPSKMVTAYHTAESNETMAILLSIFFLILILTLLILFILCCCFPKTKCGQSVRKFVFCSCLPCCSKLRRKFEQIQFNNEDDDKEEETKNQFVEDKKVKKFDKVDVETPAREENREKQNKKFSTNGSVNKIVNNNNIKSKSNAIKYAPLTTTTTTTDTDGTTTEEEEAEESEAVKPPIILLDKNMSTREPETTNKIISNQKMNRANQTLLHNPTLIKMKKTSTSTSNQNHRQEPPERQGQINKTEKNTGGDVGGDLDGQSEGEICVGCHKKLSNHEQTFLVPSARVKDAIARFNASTNQKKVDDQPPKGLIKPSFQLPIIPNNYRQKPSSKPFRQEEPIIKKTVEPNKHQTSKRNHWSLGANDGDNVKMKRNFQRDDNVANNNSDDKPAWSQYCHNCVRPTK